MQPTKSSSQWLTNTSHTSKQETWKIISSPKDIGSRINSLILRPISDSLKVIWTLWRSAPNSKVLFQSSIKHNRSFCRNLLRMPQNYWSICLGGKISKSNNSRSLTSPVFKYWLSGAQESLWVSISPIMTILDKISDSKMWILAMPMESQQKSQYNTAHSIKSNFI